MLRKGGSMVTRMSPDKTHVSIVLEKMTSKNSQCARGSNPVVAIATETVILQLKGGPLAAARKAGGLRVWYSDLTSGTQHGVG